MVIATSGWRNWTKLPPGNSDAYQSLRSIHCFTKPRIDKYLPYDLYRKSLDLESDGSAACLSRRSLHATSSRKPSLVSPDFIPFFLLPQHPILPYYSISNTFIFCFVFFWFFFGLLFLLDPELPAHGFLSVSPQTMSGPRAWNRGDTQ